MMKNPDDSIRQPVQIVEFTGHDDQHSVQITKNEVKILPSPGNHNHGSSKVKLKNIVDFTWEHRYYYGQLLAVHMSGKYLAYGIKAGNGGAVRVVNKEKEQRTLIRDMKGAIQDLAFSHVSNAILACVDQFGSLFVYTIEATAKELLYSKILHVDADDAITVSHRVIWCPYLPEEESADADEVSKLLVLTRGEKTELWSVAIASKLYDTPIKASNPDIRSNGAMLEIYNEPGTIVEATFSPDGTALATASSDGEVKFFQIYLQNSGGVQQPPQCLHQWRPHDGKPISSLFFLDDHKNYQPDAQFWRFAITGCDNNTEIKVWSCEVWTCLQTIRFTPPPKSNKGLVLKAQLDFSASYLLLSDIYNKVLYIMSISKDSNEVLACISTVTEFLLPYPILSFAIVDAGRRKLRPTSESLEDLCDCDDENEDQIVIRMYLVQPKSLQECHIAFKPAIQTANEFLNTRTHDSLDYSEAIPELSTMKHNGIIRVNDNEDGEMEDESNINETINLVTNHTANLNLMTPDAFSSPAKKESASADSNPSSPQLGNIESASPSIAQAVQVFNATDKPLATSKLEEQAPPSGGSSPSREVREILSLADPEESENEVKIEPSKENWHDIPMCLLKGALQNTIELKEKAASEEQQIKKEILPILANEQSQNKLNEIHNELEAVSNKLDAAIEVIQDQQNEISELRVELTRRRQEETPIASRVETILAKANQQNREILEQALFKQMNRDVEFHKTLETSVKDKIETVLPRVIKDIVEPLKHQLRVDVTQMDNIVKENLIKLIGGTQVRDTVNRAVTNAAKPALENAFRDTFSDILLPGMEKACQNMFKQVQDAFVRGTREYIQNVDTITNKQYLKLNEQQTEVLTTSIRDQMQAEFSRGLTLLQENTLRTMRDSIRESFSQHFSDISGVRSRATTPGIPPPSPADAQAQVMLLLRRGDLNAAFQQALSASNLSLVVLVCESTDPLRVFSGHGSRCVLEQPVLLSLIQQLSANLGHRTELKHRWLEEAVISLDPKDPVTQEHMVNVLMTLENKVAAFVSSNPNHRSVRKLKMLTMAAQSLLKPL